jgi:hypothetical protein
VIRSGRTRERDTTRPSRSVFGTAFDVVARVGTAVTLAALLVVVGTLLAMVDAEPTPTGATTTTGR